MYSIKKSIIMVTVNSGLIALWKSNLKHRYIWGKVRKLRKYRWQ